MDKNSSASKLLKDGNYELPDTCRYVCTECGCPSVLANVPAPIPTADYHPDMIERIKIQVFPSTLPPHLQTPDTPSADILDLILSYFKTGYSAPLLEGVTNRVQKKLSSLEAGMFTCFFSFLIPI